MPEIANWGKHKFIVSPSVIQSFKDLTIKGSVETTDKTTNNQKYVERKAGEAAQVTFTVQLNALTGVKDVYGEAQTYIKDAMDGKTEYMYLGPSKIVPAKLMLTQAEVSEIMFMPGKGNVWISCDVKLTMKQGSANDGDTSAESASGSGGSSGYTAKVYYTTKSGEMKVATATSQKSYADALSKAQAKVPSDALLSVANPVPSGQAKTTSSNLATTAANSKIGQAILAGQQASQDQAPTAGLNKYLQPGNADRASPL